MKIIASALTVLLSTSAFAHVEHQQAKTTAKAQQQAEVVMPSKPVAKLDGNPVYGSQWPSEGKITSIDKALETFSGEPSLQKISGTITQVCQRKGCWMILTADNGAMARVRFGDHAFYIPKDTRGNAWVYGELKQKTISEKLRKHFAEDSQQQTDAIKGEEKEFEIYAQSVVLLGE